MKRYKAKRKGFINYLVAAFTVLPLLVFLMDRETFSGRYFIMLPLLSPLILLLWVYLDTSYRIEYNNLFYRSAFLRGKINVDEIREIIKGKTMWSGIKPALSQKGLIIKYGRYDEIYIAPEDNDELISDLLKINPEIKVTG